MTKRRKRFTNLIALILSVFLLKAEIIIFDNGLGKDFRERSFLEQDTIILHELGHALKLSHNYFVQSVLNPALQADLTTYMVTNFDKVVLRRKWS